MLCFIHRNNEVIYMFILKIQQHAQYMEDPRKIVLCYNNLIIINIQKNLIFHRV